MGGVVRFGGPVVCWLVGDVRPDGSIEPAGGAVDGDDYTQVWNHRVECERFHGSGPSPRAGGSAWRPMVAGGHSVPFPFCGCGLPGVYEPYGRLMDAYRDRLGYHLRTVALVELWGRLMFQNAGVRAGHGRVLGIAISPDDAPIRKRRAQTAAERLGAALVEIDPSDIYRRRGALEALIPQRATRVTHRDFEHWAHNRSLRRWTSTTQSRSASGIGHAIGSAIGLAALVTGFGLQAAGLPDPAAIGCAVAVGAAGAGISFYKLSDFTYCIEGLAPAPDGAPASTPEPLDTQPGAPQLDLSPAIGAITSTLLK